VVVEVAVVVVMLCLYDPVCGDGWTPICVAEYWCDHGTWVVMVVILSRNRSRVVATIFPTFCEAERVGCYSQDCISIGPGPGGPGDDGCCPYTYTFIPVLYDGYYQYDNLCRAEVACYTAFNYVDIGGGGGGGDVSDLV